MSGRTDGKLERNSLHAQPHYYKLALARTAARRAAGAAKRGRHNEPLGTERDYWVVKPRVVRRHAA